MNQIINCLASGDLRSDGMANEVVGLVLENPQPLGDLLLRLDQDDSVIRTRSADALEKTLQVQSCLIEPHIPK
jgi:hypothetical protein